MKANAMHPVEADNADEIKLNAVQLHAFKDPNVPSVRMTSQGMRGLVLQKSTPVYIGGRLVDAARNPRNARRLTKKLATKAR